MGRLPSAVRRRARPHPLRPAAAWAVLRILISLISSAMAVRQRALKAPVELQPRPLTPTADHFKETLVVARIKTITRKTSLSRQAHRQLVTAALRQTSAVAAA